MLPYYWQNGFWTRYWYTNGYWSSTILGHPFSLFYSDLSIYSNSFQMDLLKHINIIALLYSFIALYRVVQKKPPILFFISKLCFTIFFPYFSGGVDSRPGRLLYYVAAHKNYRSVLCHKISSSDTAAMQDRFWQE